MIWCWYWLHYYKKGESIYKINHAFYQCIKAVVISAVHLQTLYVARRIDAAAEWIKFMHIIIQNWRWKFIDGKHSTIVSINGIPTIENWIFSIKIINVWAAAPNPISFNAQWCFYICVAHIEPLTKLIK